MANKRQAANYKEKKTRNNVTEVKKTKGATSVPVSPKKEGPKPKSTTKSPRISASSKKEEPAENQVEESGISANSSLAEAKIPDTNSGYSSSSLLCDVEGSHESRDRLRSHSSTEIWLGLPFNLSIAKPKPENGENQFDEEKLHPNDTLGSVTKSADLHKDFNKIVLAIGSSSNTDQASSEADNGSEDQFGRNFDLGMKQETKASENKSTELQSHETGNKNNDGKNTEKCSNVQEKNTGSTKYDRTIIEGSHTGVGNDNISASDDVSYAPRKESGTFESEIKPSLTDTVNAFESKETQFNSEIDSGMTNMANKDESSSQECLIEKDQHISDEPVHDSGIEKSKDVSPNEEGERKCESKETNPYALRLRKNRQKKSFSDFEIETEMEEKISRVQEMLDEEEERKTTSRHQRNTARKSSKTSKSNSAKKREMATMETSTADDSDASPSQYEEGVARKRGRGRPRKSDSFHKEPRPKKDKPAVDKLKRDREPKTTNTSQCSKALYNGSPKISKLKRERRSSRLSVKFPFSSPTWKQDKIKRLHASKRQDGASSSGAGDTDSFALLEGSEKTTTLSITATKTTSSIVTRNSSATYSKGAPPSQSLLDKRYSQQAFTLWASEARRHVLQKHGDCSESLLQDAWWKLSEAEKVPYYNRARKALQDDSRTRSTRIVKTRPQSSERGWSLTTFRCLSEGQQNSVLRRKMAALQRALSKEMYTRLLNDFHLLRILSLEEEDRDVLFRVCLEAERKLETIKRALYEDAFMVSDGLPEIRNSRFQTQLLYESCEVQNLPPVSTADIDSVLESSWNF